MADGLISFVIHVTIFFSLVAILVYFSIIQHHWQNMYRSASRFTHTDTSTQKKTRSITLLPRRRRCYD